MTELAIWVLGIAWVVWSWVVAYVVIQIFHCIKRHEDRISDLENGDKENKV